MENSIVFITESGSQIGYGHLYRSIALAKEFLNKGYEVEFSVSDKVAEELVLQHLEKINFITFSSLEKNISKYKYVFLDVFKSSWINYKKLISDSQSQVQFVSIIDNAFLDYSLDTDFVFTIGFQNYQLKLDTFKDKDERRIKKYSGNKLFVFREEFENIELIEIKKEVKNIFVSMGGSDPYRLTEMIARSCKHLKQDLTFNYVLGAGFEDDRVTDLFQIAKTPNFEINIHKNIQNMASLMIKNDAAIINGGNTRFELALLGIPFASISFNETQNNIANNLERHGIGKNIGDYNNLEISEIHNYIKFKLLPYNCRKKIADGFKDKFNNQGAQNIFELLHSSN
jgi:spore coat polysaccharide biosynthesis predicted glycosyltransferase SpsG